MKNKEWLYKYGLDFICNYGEVSKKSIAKFLNCDIHNLKYSNTPCNELIREKLEEFEIEKMSVFEKK